MARRNLIIGTAGHIDHGKTVLVKALTGRDTDRLAEEKARGISIELGFAPFALPDGTVAGIVDVPGHENFVRNMMAGATGVDVALLVVAADDGVMPQTREHLAILDLLGVSKGVVAVTKVDLVDSDFVDLVVDEVEELLDGTTLEGSPVVPVSAVTGVGIGALVQELARAASEVRLKDEALPARLPIDRVFTLKGIGTVVTGTLWSGGITDGDHLELLPSGKKVRVRSLQVHDEQRTEAYAGERVAANLAGADRDDVERGDVLCEPGYLRPTFMLDARLELLGDWPRQLKRGARVRFHHGTREVLGRVYPLEGDAIAPGETSPAQLRLETQAVCAPGDRFVLRSYSPVTTMGGGTVVDAHPPKHRPSDRAGVTEFAELEAGDPARAVAIFLRRAGRPVTAARLVLDSGLPPTRVRDSLHLLVAAGEVLTLGGGGAAQEGSGTLYLSSSIFSDIAQAARRELERFHEEKPLAEGLARETLKNKIAPDWDGRTADALFELLQQDGVLEATGKEMRLPGAVSSMTGEQSALAGLVIERIRAAGNSPPGVSELAIELSVQREQLRELLGVAEREGELVRVSPDLYFSPAAMADIEQRLRDGLGGGAGITVSEFRGVIGASRKYALPLLEYFDRNRVTVRVGDLRKLR